MGHIKQQIGDNLLASFKSRSKGKKPGRLPTPPCFPPLGLCIGVSSADQKDLSHHHGSQSILDSMYVRHWCDTVHCVFCPLWLSMSLSCSVDEFITHGRVPSNKKLLQEGMSRDMGG